MAFGTVQSQAVLTKSECFSEAERKDENPDTLIKAVLLISLWNMVAT
jgi:hypothetical protein